MKLCTECSRSPLPFFMVLFVAGVSAFVTWLTLAYSELEATKQATATGVVFLAVGATLLHYVLGCMRRHCRHGNQPQQD